MTGWKGLEAMVVIFFQFGGCWHCGGNGSSDGVKLYQLAPAKDQGAS